jgi:hypothetical protein
LLGILILAFYSLPLVIRIIDKVHQNNSFYKEIEKMIENTNNRGYENGKEKRKMRREIDKANYLWLKKKIT